MGCRIYCSVRPVARFCVGGGGGGGGGGGAKYGSVDSRYPVCSQWRTANEWGSSAQMKSYRLFI